jgi:hypothetical protein
VRSSVHLHGAAVGQQVQARRRDGVTRHEFTANHGAVVPQCHDVDVDALGDTVSDSNDLCSGSGRVGDRADGDAERGVNPCDEVNFCSGSGKYVAVVDRDDDWKESTAVGRGSADVSDPSDAFGAVGEWEIDLDRVSLAELMSETFGYVERDLDLVVAGDAHYGSPGCGDVSDVDEHVRDDAVVWGAEHRFVEQPAGFGALDPRRVDGGVELLIPRFELVEIAAGSDIGSEKSLDAFSFDVNSCAGGGLMGELRAAGAK